eukprot:TCONS_00033233-protein
MTKVSNLNSGKRRSLKIGQSVTKKVRKTPDMDYLKQSAAANVFGKDGTQSTKKKTAKVLNLSNVESDPGEDDFSRSPSLLLFASPYLSRQNTTPNPGSSKKVLAIMRTLQQSMEKLQDNFDATVNSLESENMLLKEENVKINHDLEELKASFNLHIKTCD